MADEALGSVEIGVRALFDKIKPAVDKAKQDLSGLKKESTELNAGMAGATTTGISGFKALSAAGSALMTVLKSIIVPLLAIGAAFLTLRTAKNLISDIIGNVDEKRAQIKKLANEIGDLGEAVADLEYVQKKAMEANVAIDSARQAYINLARFKFDRNYLKEHFEDILAASKNLDGGMEELSATLVRINEGMVSTRSLIRAGISKSDLANFGIKFDGDTIVSEAGAVMDAVIQIWHKKYTEGVGKDITSLKSLWQGLKNVGSEFLEMIGETGFYDTILGKMKEIVATAKVWFDSGQAKEWAEAIGGHLNGIAMIAASLGKLLASVFGIDLKSPEAAKKSLKATGPDTTLADYNEYNRIRAENDMGAGLSLEQYRQVYDQTKETEGATKDLMTVEEEYNQLKRVYADNNMTLGLSLEQYKKNLDDAKESRDDLTASEKEAATGDRTPQGYKDISGGIDAVSASISGEGSIGERITGALTGIFENTELISTAATFGVRLGMALAEGMIEALKSYSGMKFDPKTQPLLWLLFSGGAGQLLGSTKIDLAGLSVTGDKDINAYMQGMEERRNALKKGGGVVGGANEAIDAAAEALNRIMFIDQDKVAKKKEEVGKAFDGGAGEILGLLDAMKTRAESLRKKLLKEQGEGSDEFVVNANGTLGE